LQVAIVEVELHEQNIVVGWTDLLEKLQNFLLNLTFGGLIPALAFASHE
jgi:hypothetical protein